MKINNIVKESKKFKTNVFIQNAIRNISKMHFADENTSSNELIALYVKKAICSKEDDNTGEHFNSYFNVAILLAFVDRLTTPFRTPSSIDELIDSDCFTDEDVIAECVGLIAQAIFEEDSEEKIAEYASCMYDYATALLEYEGYETSDEFVKPDNSSIFNSQTDSDKSVTRTPINVVPPM